MTEGWVGQDVSQTQLIDKTT